MILGGIWIICNLPVICGKLHNYWQLWQLIFYFTQQKNGPLTNSDAGFQSRASKFLVQNRAVF